MRVSDSEVVPSTSVFTLRVGAPHSSVKFKSVDNFEKPHIMDVTAVTFGEKNGSRSFDRNARLHHPLVWSSNLIDWDSFIFLCNRDLALSADRAGHDTHHYDLLFEPTQNYAQPLCRRIGGPLESEAYNVGQRSGKRHDNLHYSFPHVERLAGNLAFVCVAGSIERV